MYVKFLSISGYLSSQAGSWITLPRLAAGRSNQPMLMGYTSWILPELDLRAGQTSQGLHCVVKRTFETTAGYLHKYGFISISL